MSEEEPINFRFAAIQIISKSLAEVKPEIINKSFNANFDIKVDTRVNADLHFVIPFIMVKIRDGDESESLAEFTIACYFEVLEFDKFIKLNENDLYQVPAPLESILRPVSISTARGIIYSELRGTYLQNTIMPVVFMKDFKIESLTDTSMANQLQN